MQIAKELLRVKPLDSEVIGLVKRHLQTSKGVFSTNRWLKTTLKEYQTMQDNEYWIDLWFDEIRLFRKAIADYPSIIKTILSH